MRPELTLVTFYPRSKNADGELMLPPSAKPDTASATFENGVLKIEREATGGRAQGAAGSRCARAARAEQHGKLPHSLAASYSANGASEFNHTRRELASRHRV